MRSCVSGLRQLRACSVEYQTEFYYEFHLRLNSEFEAALDIPEEPLETPLDTHVFDETDLVCGALISECGYHRLIC